MEIEIMMFWISSIYIGPIWALMWFAPKHNITKKFVGDIRFTVLPLCIPYAIVAIPEIPSILITLGSEMPTPELIIDFFSDDKVVILGWLHFLAFDILAGRYIWLRMVAFQSLQGPEALLFQTLLAEKPHLPKPPRPWGVTFYIPLA